MTSQEDNSLWLRRLADDDLPIFFEQQLDPEANHMAAFTRKNPTDRAQFDAHWAKIRGDSGIAIRTIVCGGQVAGHLACYGPAGEKEITYWLGRPFWGRGIATAALVLVLSDFKTRPLFARAAKDNLPSIRVLQKCGFSICGQEKSFANARGREIEELILKLE